MSSHRRLALLAATLMSLGSLGGCQSARRYSAASEPVGSASLQVAAREIPRQVEEAPFLRGPSEPVPLVSAEEVPRRARSPRNGADDSSMRSHDRNGPALRSPADDFDADEADDGDDEAPGIPDVGHRASHGSSPRQSAAVPPDRLPLVDHAGRAENARVNGRPVDRVPLPITRRLPSSSSPATTPQTTPYASAARPFPVTEPVRLEDPPALYAPPTER